MKCVNRQKSLCKVNASFITGLPWKLVWMILYVLLSDQCRKSMFHHVQCLYDGQHRKVHWSQWMAPAALQTVSLSLSLSL